ncbi:MAG: triose-phosphate isomerase [Alphaproteobacteria bacterium]|nr:triose-phosphate isomerase [Alphaproteobacteria bacterium]
MAGLRKLIAGNWKMNNLAGAGRALAAAIADDVATANAPDCDLLVCPPATILQTVAEQLRGSAVAVGGQNCHPEHSGAYTGEISAEMLADAGASYVILGHSERRHGMGETNAMVQAKVTAALRAGLVAIVCIGETEAERDAGQTLDVLSDQIDGSLPSATAALDGANTVVAYEPVWAIGSGRTPTPDEIAIAHDHIRACLQRQVGAAADHVRLLYGGSMKPDNAASILAIGNVDGGLIGGASLAASDFSAIAAAAGG